MSVAYDERGDKAAADRQGRNPRPEADTSDQEGKGRPPPAKDVLLRLALDQADYFHTADRQAFADVDLPGADPGSATFPVRSSCFREWLSLVYYRNTGKGASDATVRAAANTLQAVALHDGEQHPVFVRVGAAPDGDAWLDLADDERRAVRIHAGGWEVKCSPDVRFRRPRGMLPLPEPARGGDLDALWEFLNVRVEDRPLVVAWLLAALRPAGPYPALCLCGEQGCAKSTAARVSRALLDPNKAMLRSPPREERDLFIAANNSWLVTADNLSALPPWLSDAFCKLATGGGLAARSLYTDDEEMIFDAQRPVILTGIEDVAGRSDLRDRAVLLNLPPIPERSRKTERRFWDAFRQAVPQLLGALLDAAVLTLRAAPAVVLDRLPRMADFAVIGAAAERALGWQKDAFLNAYTRNVAETNAGVLDDALIADPLQKVLDQAGADGWHGACTDLLGRLAEVAGYAQKKNAPRDWPASPKALSNLLRRLTPNLRKEGVVVEPPAGSHKNGRRWRIYRANGQAGENTVPTVPTVPEDTQAPFPPENGPAPEAGGGTVRGDGGDEDA
jgi:hypothetical protein